MLAPFLFTLLALDLQRASLPAPTPLTAKAIQILREEIDARTGIRLPGAAANPTISLQQNNTLPAESFRISTRQDKILIEGAGLRGLVFGVGQFLRLLEMRRGQILWNGPASIASTPETKLRGHQLGYRPKTNSYDAWTLAQWDQYIRDLAIFGTNAIELIPPRSDDAADSPHFPKSPIDTMAGMSAIADSYGLDVWIWYPALDPNYADPKDVAFALKEWAGVFSKLPRVDHVLVPAGDPGHTPAKPLMAMLEKQAANLRKYHPKAGLWIAPQGFNAAELEDFFAILDTRPKWLAGIVYGPQTRLPLAKLRQRVPAQYPIRHYPDITHTLRSQYPVPDWDVAFAVTEGREPINPRPLDQAAIFRYTRALTMGFLTYSEGCNDDVNKIVWSALGWRQSTPVEEILRDYARYFIGPDLAPEFAEGLLALERNWRGPVRQNAGIEKTLALFRKMDHDASPAVQRRWRFQQAQYRAHYDALVRARVLESDARMERALANPSAAAEILRAPYRPPHLDRLNELGEALFQTIGMQLSSQWHRGEPGRGTNLDTVMAPLENVDWVLQELAQAGGAERLRNWGKPGPGSFYDDLGNPAAQPHLLPGQPYADDPAFFASPLAFFDLAQKGPRSWWTHTIGLYEQPIEMRYTELDPRAQYRLRVVYGSGPVRLMANGANLIHDYLEKPYQFLDFDVPRSATASGTLDLRFSRPPGAGGAGRGNQVADVWLLRVP